LVICPAVAGLTIRLGIVASIRNDSSTALILMVVNIPSHQREFWWIDFVIASYFSPQKLISRTYLKKTLLRGFLLFKFY
jgi:hypothetical protein